jgi:hypothetical protein
LVAFLSLLHHRLSVSFHPAKRLPDILKNVNLICQFDYLYDDLFPTTEEAFASFPLFAGQYDATEYLSETRRNM